MQGAVQTAVAKSGKIAVQGAVQGVVQTAVAKSGKGAVQGAAQGAVQRAALCFPRWEPSVPSFRNWKFFAMATYGSQVGSMSSNLW